MPRKTNFNAELFEEHAYSSREEENVLLNNTPWWAISVAMHAIVLLMIWSIVIADVVAEDTQKVIVGASDEEFIPPPEIPPPPIQEDLVTKVVEDPNDPERLIEVEDVSENPDPDRPPSENKSNVEGPYPDKGFNSSFGLGGNIGGGGGPGGGGGGFPFRGTERDHPPTDKNVFAALYWLRDHQNMKTGSWSSDNFIEQCKSNSPSPYVAEGSKSFKRDGVCSSKDGSPDTGWKMGTDGVTGLATLAFLGAGYTHKAGEFQYTVKKALRYLISIQTDDGCFGPKEDEHFVYNHAICTMAMVEAYGMTGAIKFKSPSQLAIDFIAKAQNNDPDRGWLGWRYGVKPGENDGSVTGWMVLALKSAKLAGLNVEQRCWDGAIQLYDDLTSDPNENSGITGDYPRTGYLTKGGPNARLKEASNYLTNPSIDAINVICRLFMGTSRKDSVLQSQSRLMTIEREGNLPTIDNPDKIDFYYWYYASLAMFQMGGEYWKKWENPLIDCLTGLQRLEDIDTCVYGSWDPVGAWGTAGGRVYATAINALTLEVYYRYEYIGANTSHKK